MVGKPNLVKCFGPRLRLWTWTLDFVPGPSFSIVFTSELQVTRFVVSDRLRSQINIFRVKVFFALYSKVYDTFLSFSILDLDLGSSQLSSSLSPGIGVTLLTPKKALAALE